MRYMTDDIDLKELCEFIDDYIMDKWDNIIPIHDDPKYSRFVIEGIKRLNFFAVHSYKEYIRLDITRRVIDKKNLFYKNENEDKNFKQVHVVTDINTKIEKNNSYPGYGKIVLTINNKKEGKERYSFMRDNRDPISFEYILDILEKNYEDLLKKL